MQAYHLLNQQSHDENMYPEPMMFRPERFIGVPDAKDGGPRDPNTIAFGWVRNIFSFKNLS
jgi:cytochrome P450